MSLKHASSCVLDKIQSCEILIDKFWAAVFISSWIINALVSFLISTQQSRKKSEWQFVTFSTEICNWDWFSAFLPRSMKDQDENMTQLLLRRESKRVERKSLSCCWCRSCCFGVRQREMKTICKIKLSWFRGKAPVSWEMILVLIAMKVSVRRS